MIVYYALGGGLGHLVRARRVLGALGTPDAALLSASPFACDARVVGDLPVIPVPVRLGHDRVAFRAWLADVLRALAPDELIVDSFPGGILGELCGLELPPARHVARLLRWPAYARRCAAGPLPRYEMTYVLERLTERQEHALRSCSRELRALELPVPVSGTGTSDGTPLSTEPHWLVVHSGPDEEVVELAEYAAERAGTHAQIVVVTPHRPSRLPVRARWLDVHPVAPHLAHAKQIVTAAGFNATHETSALRRKHHAIPVPRPLDDQYARARRARHDRSEDDRAPLVRDHPVVEVAA